jgi:hypothetical protein
MRPRPSIPAPAARVAALIACVVGSSALYADTAKSQNLPLPGGPGGIGFDDLRFDRASGKLLIPAGRSGNIDIIDPVTLAISPISGFTKVSHYASGHGQSVTSVDAGNGLLFATDRSAKKLAIVDPKLSKIVGETALRSAPDYVRYVAPTREVWVTQPGASRIEIFSLSKANPPVATHSGFIEVRGGPESLAVDAKRGRAYAHLWKDSTVSIDVRTRTIVATWSAGCGDPRGIWIDEDRGFLLVGCEDGTASALDVDHGGRLLSKVKSGKGVDIIAYDRKRAHFYLPGDESATMAIIGVSAKGMLTVLGTVPTVGGAHCVTTDERGHAYVCDPEHGQLLVIPDPYPAAS